MSLLIFVDTLNEIVLTKVSKDSLREVGRWPAHNNVDSRSNGPWPAGIYRWSHYNAHLEAGLLPASMHSKYGGTGIHVFEVSGRPGMGVHAGRTVDPTKVGGVTMGCVRTTTEGMFKINDVHREDALTHLVVVKKGTLEAVNIIKGDGQWPVATS